MGTLPQIRGLDQLMSMWTNDELAAFFCCVRADASVAPPNERKDLISRSVEELFWTYNSKTKAQATLTAAKAAHIAYENMPNTVKKHLPVPPAVKLLHEYGTTLSYEMLLRECCKKLKIEKSEAEDHNLLQIYLFEKIMILAVAAMTAEQRHMFLTCKLKVNDISISFPQTELKNAATTLGALGFAQASGFGIYLGATTALGFLTHAVGVTLPFAVYTGMSSTIAFLIGPAGFLAVGAWLGHSLTSPEWTRIIRALLHIIAMRAKYEYKLKPLALETSSVGS